MKYIIFKNQDEDKMEAFIKDNLNISISIQGKKNSVYEFDNIDEVKDFIVELHALIKELEENEV